MAEDNFLANVTCLCRSFAFEDHYKLKSCRKFALNEIFSTKSGPHSLNIQVDSDVGEDRSAVVLLYGEILKLQLSNEQIKAKSLEKVVDSLTPTELSKYDKVLRLMVYLSRSNLRKPQHNLLVTSYDVFDDCSDLFKTVSHLQSQEEVHSLLSDEGYRSVDSVSTISEPAENIWISSFKALYDSEVYSWDDRGCSMAPPKPYATDAGSDVTYLLWMHLQLLEMILHPQLPYVLESSEITKEEVFDGVVLLLMGIPSKLFAYNQEGQCFVGAHAGNVHIEGISPHLLNSCLSPWLESGACFARLNALLRLPVKSLILDSLLHALSGYLAQYSAKVMELAAKCRPSLMSLSFSLTMLQDQIRHVAHVFSCSTPQTGLLDCLSVMNLLWEEALAAIGSSHYVVLVVFLRAALSPYLHFVFQWIYYGHHYDPYGEFLLVVNNEHYLSKGEAFWMKAYVLVADERIPFALKGMASLILHCGKSLNLLRLYKPEHHLLAPDPVPPPLRLTFNTHKINLMKETVSFYQRMQNEKESEAIASIQEKLHAKQELKRMKFAENLARDRIALQGFREERLAQEKVCNAAKQSVLMDLKEQMIDHQKRKEEEKKRANEENLKFALEERLQLMSELAREKEDKIKASHELALHYENLLRQASQREIGSQRFVPKARLRRSEADAVQQSSANLMSFDIPLLDGNSACASPVIALPSWAGDAPNSPLTCSSNVSSKLSTSASKDEYNQLQLSKVEGDDTTDGCLPFTGTTRKKSVQRCHLSYANSPLKHEPPLARFLSSDSWRSLRVAHSQPNVDQLVSGSAICKQELVPEFIPSPVSFHSEQLIGLSTAASPLGNSHKVFAQAMHSTVQNLIYFDKPAAKTVEEFEDISFDLQCPHRHSPIPYPQIDIGFHHEPIGSRISSRDYSESNDDEDVHSVHWNCLQTTVEHLIDRSLIMQGKLVSRCVINFFRHELRLDHHLGLIRDFILFRNGEFGQCLTSKLSSKLCGNPSLEEITSPTYLNQILSTAFESCSFQAGTQPAGFSFQIRQIPDVLNICQPDCLNFLSLTHTVEWRLKLILSDAILADYGRLFSYLVMIKRVVWVLQDIWHRLKNDALLYGACRSPQFIRLHLIRQEMEHIVGVMHSYISSQLIDILWNEFFVKYSSANDLDSLIGCHRTFVSTCLQRCFLNKSAKAIYQTIYSELKSILQFHTYLTSSNWHLNTESHHWTHPCYNKLVEAYTNFQRSSLFVLKVIKQMKRDQGLHLDELFLKLDYNGFYERSKVK